MPLTQRELNKMGCGTPNCTHDHSVLYLTPKCHDYAGLEVRYEKATGNIVATCQKCERTVGTIKVAAR